MITEQQIKDSTSLLLKRLFDGRIERMCNPDDCMFHAEYPARSFEEWRSFVVKMCENLDFLATWHVRATQPHDHFEEDLPTLISLLSDSGRLLSNRAVTLWYLKHVAGTVPKNQLEEELQLMMRDLTKKDLKQVLDHEMSVNNKRFTFNVFARLLYVARWLLPIEVESLLSKHGLEVHA